MFGLLYVCVVFWGLSLWKLLNIFSALFVFIFNRSFSQMKLHITCCITTDRRCSQIPNSYFSHVPRISKKETFFRGAEEKAASTCGHLEMVVAMTTATVMVMPRACGQSPSTQPSMTDARPCTTRAAPPRWRPRSATDARGTQRQAL